MVKIGEQRTDCLNQS